MTALEKAHRLLTHGRLCITAADTDHASARCRGDTGDWDVTWNRHTGWHCTCPAYGTRCSHIAALRLVTTQEIHLDWG